MVIQLHNKRPKPIDWLTLAKLAFLLVCLFFISGCSDAPWNNLGYHSPIVGHIQGGLPK